MDDIAEYLRLAGGGRFGNGIIAPNNASQFVKVTTRLERVQNHQFFQVFTGLLPQV